MEPITPLWITCGATAVGVIYAIIRNGSRSRKQDGILKAELKLEVSAVKDQLNDPDTGLKAIKRSVDEQKLHCAQVSTSLAERVGSAEKSINDIKNQPRRKGKG